MVNIEENHSIKHQISRIALIASDVALSKYMIDIFAKKNIECHVITCDKKIANDLKDHDIAFILRGNIVQLMKYLRLHNLKDLMLTGAIKSNLKMALHFKSIRLFYKLRRSERLQQDATHIIIDFLKSEKFNIIYPEEISPDLLIESGALTTVRPSNHEIMEITKGLAILQGVSTTYRTSSLVMHHDLVVGFESKYGLYELIKRCSKGIENCILIKAAYHDDYIPSNNIIDVFTIKILALYKIKGIAIEVKSAIILDQATTIQEANKLGIFIYGI